jgi:hypothetical protein
MKLSNITTRSAALARWCRALAALALGATGAAHAQATLPVNGGEIVTTLSGPNDLGDVVVELINTTNPVGQGAPLGGACDAAWSPNRFWNAGAGTNEWTYQNLGQVYGVTLDGATNPNIYVTAFSFYGFGTIASVPANGPGGDGAIYRLDGTTGAICVLANLPNSGAALGNITYRLSSNTLYVSNFEDGLVYKIPLGANVNAPVCPYVPSTGGYITWDHGVNGRPSEGLLPIPDTGQPGATQLGRRIWGLAVKPNENRLYYGVWWDDAGNANAAEQNEVWSVALAANGDFVPGSAVREVQLPNYTFGGYSSPPAGLNFKNSGELLVGERSVLSAHDSRLLEYTGATGAWVAAPMNKYLVGRWSTNTNCSGGVAPDCDGNVWTTGDALVLVAGGCSLNPAIYGLQRINNSGNTADVPVTLNSYLIDSDNSTLSSSDKQQIGSVAIRNICPPPCPTLNTVALNCVWDNNPNTNTLSYTFTFTNTTNLPVQYLTFGVNGPVTPNSWVFPNAVLPGQTSPPVTVTLNIPAGQTQFCFNVTFLTPEGNTCCLTRHCLDVPDCDCLQLRETLVRCTPGVPGSATLTFNMQNLGNVPFNELYLFPQPPGSPVVITPNAFSFPNVVPGAFTGLLNVNITGAQPGPLCIRFTVHLNGEECCSEVICFNIPDCRIGTGPCDPIDFNNDGLFPDTQDIDDFLAVFAGGPCSNDPNCNDIDFNNDGLFPDTLDIDSLLSVFSGGPCP